MNNVLQLVLLLVALFAKEQLLPNLFFMMNGKKRVAPISGGQEHHSPSQQGTANHESHTGGTKRQSGGLEREVQELHQKLDRLSKQLIDQMNAQQQEMSARLNGMAADWQHHGDYLPGGEDGDEPRQLLYSNSTTMEIIAKIDERFQELMEKMENSIMTSASRDDPESSTKSYVSAELERVSMQLQTSLETQINHLVRNVKALSLGFAATVTLALGALALPKLTDWIQSLLAPMDE